MGQGALKAADFYGEVAANDATNNTLQKVNDVLYGDPSKPSLGPDGKPAPDTGYFGRRGADAMSARPDVTSRIDEIIAEGADGLSTPAARQAYENETRRARMQWQREVGAHADQQQRTWSIDTNNTSATIALNGLARDPLNPDVVARTTDAVRGALVKNAQLNGEDAAGAILKADQSIALMQAQSLLPTDPQATLKLLNDKKDLIASTPGYDALYDRALSRVRDVSAHTAADLAIGTPLPAGTGGGHATGAPSSDPNFAGQLFVKAPDGVVSYTGPKIPTEQQAQAALAAILPGVKFGSAERSPADNAATHGAAVNSMHLRGHAVDIPIANLPPGVSEAAAIQQIRDAGFPATEMLGSDYAKAHGEGPHIHVGWEPKSGGGQAGPDQPKPIQTPADNYRANWAAYEDRARQAYLAIPGNENDTEGADRAASLADTKMRAVITQDEMRIKADYYALDTAALKPGPNGQRPTTIDQLLQSDPSLREAWENLQLTNPYAAINFEDRRLKANAMPANTTYGNQFYDLYGKVVSGQIKNPAMLLPYIDARKGDGSPLTSEGYDELKGLVTGMSTPQGSSLARAESDFFKRIRPNISLTNPSLNMVDDVGDKQFNHFMIAALARIRADTAAGVPPGKIFDPKGDVAVLAQQYMASPLDMSKRMISSLRAPAGFGAPSGNAPPDVSTPDGLKKAVAAGLIPRDKGIELAIKNRWVAAPKPAIVIPTPH